MHRRFGLVVAVCALTWGGSAPVRAEVVVIEGVPSYLWYHGCGPTAGGMLVGYWDAHGFGDLIDGSNDWAANGEAVRAMIASPGHIRDYAPTPDRPASPDDPYHADDSLADFMGTSRGRLPHGDSYDSRQASGLAKYFAFRGYAPVRAWQRYVWGLWADFTAGIDAGRPAELFVDRSGDGVADHFIAAFGYDDTDPAAPRFLGYNTYDHVARWYDFVPVRAGLPWGVYAGVLLDPGPMPGDADVDGDVDVADYLHLKRAAADGAEASWSAGDFDADGDRDSVDLRRMGENFGLRAAGGVAGAAGGNSPEPASAWLLALPAGWGLCGRPRRRWRLRAGCAPRP